MGHLELLVIFSIIMLPGVAGVWLPLVPGIPYMLVVALVFAGIDRFQHLTGQELIILGILALASLVIDYVGGLIGAKFGGASKTGLLYGFLGLLVGMLILPPLGGFVGLFLGVLLAELQRQKTKTKAVKAAAGSLIGSVVAIGLNIVLALIFFVLFIIFGLK